MSNMSWWNVCQKKLKPLEEKITVDPTISIISEKCLCNSTSRNLAGGVCLRGNTIIGGNTWPDAEAHVNMVCVFPFSADVTAYTLWRPISATTLPGLWTTLTPVSSQLYNLHRFGYQVQSSVNSTKLSEPCLHTVHDHMIEAEVKVWIA